MRTFILRLTNRSASEAARLLNQNEIWNLIPYDSFIRYGLGHPEHQWFGEIQDGELVRAVYIHHQLVHLISSDVPPIQSPIYRLLQRQKSKFIIHGPKELLDPFLQGFTQYHAQKMEDAQYVRQITKVQISKLKERRNSKKLFLPAKGKLAQLTIRIAQEQDFNNIMSLYQNSSVSSLADPHLIQQLVRHQKVLVVSKNHLSSANSVSKELMKPGSICGTLMYLKESPRYMLLGGLYVSPEYRKLGIASALALRAIKEVNSKGQSICFYFNDPKLKKFYSQIALKRVGQWATYVVTSKAQI